MLKEDNEDDENEEEKVKEKDEEKEEDGNEEKENCLLKLQREKNVFLRIWSEWMSSSAANKTVLVKRRLPLGNVRTALILICAN